MNTSKKFQQHTRKKGGVTNLSVQLYLKIHTVNGYILVDLRQELEHLHHGAIVRHAFLTLSSVKVGSFPAQLKKVEIVSTELNNHLNPTNRNRVLLFSQIMNSFEWLLVIVSQAIKCNRFSLQNTNHTQALAPEPSILFQIFTVYNLLLILISREQESQILVHRCSYPQRSVLFNPSES